MENTSIAKSELDISELENVTGGIASCYYAGQQYSEGATIKGSDGARQQCNAEGKWVSA